MNNIDKINKLLELENSGIFSFGAITEKKSLKKSRLTKEVTPENIRILYKVVLCSVRLGSDYQKAVNNRLAKEGKVQDFKSQGTYTNPVNGSKIVLKHKDNDTHYLRVYPNLCFSFNTRKEYFDSDGNHVSYKKFKKLEQEYFSMPSNNKSQGLDDQIIVNNYKMVNVKYVKQGNFKVEDMTFEEIKQLLDNLLNG